MSSYLTCRVGLDWYGINIDDVLEVLPMIALNNIPGSDVVGVMKLREHIVPVVDLREVFQVPEYSYQVDLPIIALRCEDGSVAVIVDEADNVVFLDEQAMTPHAKNGIRSLTILDDRMLFILDVSDIKVTGTGTFM